MRRARAFGLATGALAVLVGATIWCGPSAAAIWNVSTVGQLTNAVNGAGPNDEIIIAGGTYNLTQGLNLSDVGLTIRGATGNRDDVILVGGGMNTHGVDEGLLVNVSNITVRDLTLKSFFYNAIHLRGENDISGITVSNVKTWNIGERHIKGSWDSNINHTLDNTLIENVYMLQTEPRLDTNPSGGDYIGGMDIMSSNNITIRDCVAEGIRGYTGGGNASIFLWQGHNNFTIERNVIIGTNKGIGIGLTYQAGPTISGGWHGDGGIIRNNTILRSSGYDGNNIGLELCGVKNTEVYNNTVYSADASYFRTLSFWDNTTIPNTNLQVIDNIVRGGVFDIAGGDWSAAAVAALGNIVDTTGAVVTSNWFVDAANGDFHLTEQALAAMDAATVLADVPADMDQALRGALPDMGADEFGAPMGDANHDGKVDGADYTIWADHYKQPGTWVTGDFNGDQVVNGADYTLWADSFGFGTGAGASVPEPATVMLLVLGACAAGLRRRGP